MIEIDSVDPPSGPQRLQEIASALKSGESVQSVTVREFLGWFGAAKRGYRIVRGVRNSLKKAGLATNPDFESVWIGAQVEFKIAGEGALHATLGTLSLSAHGALADSSADTAPLVSIGVADPTNRLGKLAAANVTPLSIKPDEPLSKAITLMLVNDYSQLPVMTSERDVKGVVSWQSIGSRWALDHEGEKVSDYMDETYDVSAERPLFEALPVIIDRGYVLVRDNTRKVVGIVTATDLGQQFQQLAEPFLLLGEIENQIRRLLDGKFTKTELESVKEPNDPRPIETVADLTFGQYVRLLQKPANWDKVAPTMDRVAFTTQLDQVREIRNDVMHFDPDPMDEDDLELLRRFARFLQRLQTLGV